MSKTKGNVVDPLEAIDTAGADALRFALLNGTSPGNDQKFSQRAARGRPELRQQALERHALRRRRAAGLHRPEPARRATDAGRLDARPDRALDPLARGGHGRCRRSGLRRRQLRRGLAGPVRRDLGRVLRLGDRAGEGPARRSGTDRRRARDDLVDPRRGARHLPPPAASDHALRHRGVVGLDPARRRGPRAADRGPLAEGRRDRCGARGRRGAGDRAHPRRPQRARRGRRSRRRLAFRSPSAFPRPCWRTSRPSAPRSSGWRVPSRCSSPMATCRPTGPAAAASCRSWQGTSRVLSC